MNDVLRPAGLLAVVALAFAMGVSRAAAQDPRPTGSSFRAGVDVISVDVQVIDSDGQPVAGLAPDAFEVTVDGRRRRVLSADFVDTRSSAVPAPAADSPVAVSSSVTTAGEAGTTSGSESLAPRRVYVLAVDRSRLDEFTARPILAAVSDFLAQLRSQDEVGVFTYPTGPTLDPTTDRDAVVRVLQTIQAVRELPPPGEFAMSPSNVVEISRRPESALAMNVILTFCATASDQQCPDRVRAQATSEVLFYEGVASAGSATLRALMAALGDVADRKTVVIISGGVVTADIVGARPEGAALFRELGRVAAQSNVTVYALFVDQSWQRQMAAELGRPPVAPDPVRERELTGRVLDQLTDAAGGTVLRISSGDGRPAFDRVLRETSAYYLLGVESTDDDRDGRLRELRVRVRDRRVSVRGRSWLGGPRSATPAPVAASAPRPEEAPPVLPPATPEIRRLAEAFDRDDRAAIVQAFAPSEASRLLRAFREHESPWPASPRRTAAFALDLAMVGVRIDSVYVKEEALRVLGEYLVRVRGESSDDAFECTWLWTASAGTAGLFAPELGTLVAERAAERCPTDASLRLARAVARDQQLMLFQRQGTSSSAATDALSDLEQQVLEAYEAAAELPAARFEARIRAAQLLFRAGRYEDGLTSLDAAGAQPDDHVLRYYASLVRGQLLYALGRFDESAAACRAALDAWPGAQSARVALVSALIGRGRLDEATTIAGNVLSAPPTPDPWWVYFLGDYRAYDDIRSRLGQVAR
ncbi:MAG: hypothetical protein ABS36_13850 [Acidobacteria bacterium SCN 69-37]|nr:MAG: hypothetical protein ABS36_13850 [Acidobacteria bacterium SCN 69-37]